MSRIEKYYLWNVVSAIISRVYLQNCPYMETADTKCSRHCLALASWPIQIEQIQFEGTRSQSLIGANSVGNQCLKLKILDILPILSLSSSSDKKVMYCLFLSSYFSLRGIECQNRGIPLNQKINNLSLVLSGMKQLLSVWRGCWAGTGGHLFLPETKSYLIKFLRINDGIGKTLN